MLLISPQHTFPQGLVSKLQELGADIMYDVNIPPSHVGMEPGPEGFRLRCYGPKHFICLCIQEAGLKTTESKIATVEAEQQCWVSGMAPQCHNGEWWYMVNPGGTGLMMHKIHEDLWPYMSVDLQEE